MSTAVVIGGGISGLSSAYYLQKSSRFAKIIVLESSKRVGGWLKTLNTEHGGKMEMGPRSIRSAGLAGLNMLYLTEELGLSDEVIPVPRSSPSSKNRFIYSNNRLNKMPNGMLSLLAKTPPFAEPLLVYAYNDIFTKGGSKEDESMFDFMSRRFGEDIAKYAADPLCRGIFAGDCRKLSVKSCFPLLYSAEQRSGSVLRGLAFGPRAKQQMKPCGLVTRKTNERWSVFSFKQGLQQLSDTLRDAIEQNSVVEIAMNSPCSHVCFSNGKATVTVNGDTIEADHVVSSLYASDFAKLLSKDHSELKKNLENIPAVDAAVTCLEFDGKMELLSPGFGHLTTSFENSCVLGVIYDSCTFPQHDRPDRPSTRFTVMMGGGWFDDLKKAVPSMTTDDLGKFATRSLQTQLGVTDEPVNVHTEIHRRCIPQYVVGHDKVMQNIFSGIEKHRLPLSLVGSSYRGPSVNECINTARLEMEKITGTSLQ